MKNPYNGFKTISVTQIRRMPIITEMGEALHNTRIFPTLYLSVFFTKLTQTYHATPFHQRAVIKSQVGFLA